MIICQVSSPLPTRFQIATKCDDVTCVTQVPLVVDTVDVPYFEPGRSEEGASPAVVYIVLVVAILALFIVKLLRRRP